MVTGIVDVLRTGGQWKAMPNVFGSGSALHADFQEWVERRVFHNLWRRALPEYDDLTGIDGHWQCWDGAMTTSPLGGKTNREKPDQSWPTGRHAFRVDRRSRCAAGHRHRRSQGA